MTRCALVALACSSLASACGPAGVSQPAPAPPRAPYAAPADLLPADLDAAFRIDVKRLASELGVPLASKAIVDLVVEPADDAAGWLAEVMDQSEVAWLGVRLAPTSQPAEKVLIARGAFAGWRPEEPAGFRWVEPLDGSSARYLREGAPAGAFRHIHTLEDRLLLLATSAAMDPLGQSGSGSGTAALRPPERGTLSATARAPELSRVYLGRFPRLAAHMAGALQVSGYVEPHATNLDFDLEVTFSAAEQARGGRDVLVTLFQRLGEQPCAIGQAARLARVEAFERSVRISAELAQPVVRNLKACAFTGECCGGARSD